MNREFINLDIFNKLWEVKGRVGEEETMKKNYKDMTVGEGLITALEQAVDYEKGKKVIGVTSRKMSIAPLPDYKAPKIKEIRKRLGISQSTFAYVIGVSKKTIEAWECGRNKPQGPAQRILMFLEEDNKFIEKYKLMGV